MIWSAGNHDFKEFLAKNLFPLPPVVRFAEKRLGFAAEQLPQGINFNAIQFNF